MGWLIVQKGKETQRDSKLGWLWVLQEVTYMRTGFNGCKYSPSLDSRGEFVGLEAGQTPTQAQPDIWSLLAFPLGAAGSWEESSRVLAPNLGPLPRVGTPLSNLHLCFGTWGI